MVNTEKYSIIILGYHSGERIRIAYEKLLNIFLKIQMPKIRK